MKRLLLTSLLTLLYFFIHSQGVGISKTGYVNISKVPPKPPYLEIVKNSLSIKDGNGNNIIDANEKVIIYFQLKNSGNGQGLNLVGSIKEENGISDLHFNETFYPGSLNVGEERQIQIPVIAGNNLPDGAAIFSIKINEPNGFGTDDQIIKVQTRAFRTPTVKVVDWAVSSEYGALQRRRPFDVQVSVQNVGEGMAKDIRAKLILPEGVLALSDTNVFIGNLKPGEDYLIDYNLITTINYRSSTIPLYVKLSESYGRYSENRTITLTINQEVTTEMVEMQGKEEPEEDFEIASLTSKVDKNIPLNRDKNPFRIALVIGNENYSGGLNAGTDVDYAVNDAKVFSQYAKKVLGVKEENIRVFLNATSGQMLKGIEWAAEYLKRLGNKGELIFYYAGHGFPEEASMTPYIVPVDVDATNISAAIKLSDVYQKFGNTEAKRITIFMDACFSGKGRNKGLLAARKVAIKPKEEMIPGNMVVFSASSGIQSALPYRKEKHGIFTYFLLYKLQQTRGNLTYGELADYLKDEVGTKSLAINDKPQDPEVNVSYRVENIWRKWEIR